MKFKVIEREDKTVLAEFDSYKAALNDIIRRNQIDIGNRCYEPNFYAVANENGDII